MGDIFCTVHRLHYGYCGMKRQFINFVRRRFTTNTDILTMMDRKRRKHYQQHILYQCISIKRNERTYTNVPPSGKSGRIPFGGKYFLGTSAWHPDQRINKRAPCKTYTKRQCSTRKNPGCHQYATDVICPVIAHSKNETSFQGKPLLKQLSIMFTALTSSFVKDWCTEPFSFTKNSECSR